MTKETKPEVHQFCCAVYHIPICKCYARKAMKAYNLQSRLEKAEEIISRILTCSWAEEERNGKDVFEEARKFLSHKEAK